MLAFNLTFVPSSLRVHTHFTHFIHFHLVCCNLVQVVEKVQHLHSYPYILTHHYMSFCSTFVASFTRLPPFISSNVIYILNFGFRFQGARSPAFNCMLASLRWLVNFQIPEWGCSCPLIFVCLWSFVCRLVWIAY